MLPESSIFEDIAIDLGVNPAFIEKDWYAIQVLAAIANVSQDQILPVFCGGTSLSKAYRLLKRFSEDLDFRAHFLSENAPSKSVRRIFRTAVMEAVETVQGIQLDRGQVESGSSYFKFPLSYEHIFDAPGGLRPFLQVEFSYTQPKAVPEQRQVKSFVAEYSGAEPEAKIACLMPIETGADKLCAFTWRVIKRNRISENDDPTMIRHLHDLGCLHPMILENPKLFIELTKKAFAIDMESTKRALDKSLVAAAEEALRLVTNDPIYAREYSQFIFNMSYASDKDTLDFKSSLESLGGLIKLLGHGQA